MCRNRISENSPAIYGWEKRTNESSPVRDGRTFLSSLPGLETFPNREPSHKWAGAIFKANASSGNFVYEPTCQTRIKN
jgi:hypothetical protein